MHSLVFSDFRSTKTMTGGENITNITDFILLGFSDFPHIRAVLFVVFLVIYILTLTWNLCLIVLIKMDPHLHIPMYFFISNLPFIDICYVSSTAPKMLYDFFQEKPTITFVGCAIQYFVFSTMGLSESCLMTVMAYDRYAAICNPLLYSSIMSPSLCGRMVLGSYMAGLSGSLSQVCAMLQLHFCGPNVIHHFFCDMPQLWVLSCSNTFFVRLLTAISAMIFGIVNALVIMISYIYIVISIMKITSAKGRSKAFNTCASHLTAVTLFLSSIPQVPVSIWVPALVVPQALTDLHQSSTLWWFLCWTLWYIVWGTKKSKMPWRDWKRGKSVAEATDCDVWHVCPVRITLTHNNIHMNGE